MILQFRASPLCRHQRRCRRHQKVAVTGWAVGKPSWTGIGSGSSFLVQEWVSKSLLAPQTLSLLCTEVTQGTTGRLKRHVG